MRFRIVFTLLLPLLISCEGIKKERVDLIVRNATIYTVDENFSMADAMAIKGDTIVAIGSEHEILNKYQSGQEYDARKKFVYPGFNDAHSHFLGYAEGLTRVNLVGTQSWQECIDRVEKYAQQHSDGWILGRGWDQNDWENQAFPNKFELDSLFPNRPVLLKRIDGHAAIANSMALKLAGVNASSVVFGGDIYMKDSVPTGILIDNAVDLVNKVVPQTSYQQKARGLRKAQKNLFQAGVTSLTDAGLNVADILLIDSLQNSGLLKIRTYIMVSDDSSNLRYFQERGKIKNDYLNVRSFKFYVDGALGSRGAAMLEPYSDATEENGLLLSAKSHFEEMASIMLSMDFQMNAHCIGDSANRLTLDVMGKALKGVNDKRWRIEHAQVIDPNDLSKFKAYTVIPSVQPTHATSDASWAKDRLGERIKNAYIYKDLLQQNGTIPLGTDFPVEDIDPLKTFYAAVYRKTPFDASEEAFQPENALTAEDALRGITIWPALAAFEEKEKGSLEPGKFADFVVLNGDLLNIPEDQFSTLKVISTFSGGIQVFQETN